MNEQASNPSNPTESDQAKVYFRNDKFVVKWDDAGTIRYHFLDMNATIAQSFSGSTSEP